MRKVIPTIQALLAALLFGISTPISKILLNDIDPVPLASFLYLGSGMGLFLFQFISHKIIKRGSNEAPLSKKEIPWLIGAVAFGGIIAPIILMLSLKNTPASTASLLLNFECVATSIIALIIFKEYIGKRTGIAVAAITIGSILLSWDFSNEWGISLGALGILLACICWGVDNNFTRNISMKNPFTIVTIKGISAGVFSLMLSFIIKSEIPAIKTILIALILGFFSYGLSIVLFVLAMRELGSARASAFFGTAPFLGAILSFIIFKTVPNIMIVLAIPIMITGVLFIIIDKHEHEHTHKFAVHNHKHAHNDIHHEHDHDENIDTQELCHSHLHEHKEMEHSHMHFPDIHHRH